MWRIFGLNKTPLLNRLDLESQGIRRLTVPLKFLAVHGFSPFTSQKAFSPFPSVKSTDRGA